ncbi:hypothetical protein EC604_01355 [Paenibacillus amylolyticus]|uniref:Uncharacterized protein n=1 Tax=Paenibacillus amylolyticus TaxID=1451 RepID=A0A5M9WLR2_PAEAM|nr:hypothetical protein [Paenibacillus amylolyticus]KAA8782495.1 hypothetical protein EC604_01355 [Paenibacillus amylolyticus]
METSIEKLFSHISKTLPAISDSVNEISNYIQNNPKVDVKLINSIYKLTSGLKLRELETPDKDASKDIISLYRDYYDGITEIMDGVMKLISILQYQNDLELPEGAERFEGTDDEARIQIESAVNDLYDGSKKIVSVIDRAST